MNKERRDLIEWAEQYGYRFDGQLKSGHYRLKHKTGRVVTIAATPSDHRSVLNERAQLLRVAGCKEDKPAAARYRHRRQSGYTDTYGTPATDDAPWIVAAKELAEVDARLETVNPRSDEAWHLAQQRLHHEATLQRYYQPVPPRPKIFRP